MIADRITVEYVHPPIPTRAFDYCATFAGYEPGDPVGHGVSRYDAILDLLAASNDEPCAEADEVAPLIEWVGR